MADNASLGAAKTAKNDEFFTQYSDIEAEMNAYVEYNPNVFRGMTILLPCDDPEWSNFTKYFAANFERFGLQKLISTSYAKGAGNQQLTLFEMESPLYDETLHDTHGKLFTLTRDIDSSGSIDTDDIEFTGYLEGDGDFRSVEVTKLRDEADIIITNPPFSLFREFLAWIMDGKKKFIIVGNQNAFTYKEVFPLLRDNKAWIGYSYPKQFLQPDGTFKMFGNVCWFANIDFGSRHEPLMLDTEAHNLKFNKKLQRKLEHDYGKTKYPRYDNYDAIEVPYVECIPADYRGIMGVPISFLNSYCPDQFEIVMMANGNARTNTEKGVLSSVNYIPTNGDKGGLGLIDGKLVYARIIIRFRGNAS